MFHWCAFHRVYCYFQVTGFSSNFIPIASFLTNLLKHWLHAYFVKICFLSFFSLSASECPVCLPTLLAMCSDEIEFFSLCLQVQAADSLLKLVSELKQSAVFSDFLSLNRSINQRILKFGEQSEETEKLLVSIGDEVADSLKDLESHYYASPNRGIECEVPYFQHSSNGDGA